MTTIQKMAILSPKMVEDMVTVWESAVRATHDFLAESDIVGFRCMVREALPVMETVLSAFTDEGTLAGFLACQDRKIEMLFVHDDFRGQGIGRQLALEAVRTAGAHSVDVNEQNVQGRGFYEYLGFTVAGRSPMDGQGNPFPLLHMVLGTGSRQV